MDRNLLYVMSNCKYAICIRIDLNTICLDIRNGHLNVVDSLKALFDVYFCNTGSTGNV